MISEERTALAALSDSLADTVEAAGRHIVSVSARRRAHGSGIQWKPGIVVTADHVIEREESITVTLPDGSQPEASLVGRDPTTDLAVLAVSGLNLGTPSMPAEPARPGQIVIALARPGDHGLSVSFGIISSVGPEFNTQGGGRIDQFLRPDVTLYPGFSGGALIDGSGRLIGLNTSGFGRGLPLTMPAATVERVVGQLVKNGRVSRGYLGLRLQGVELPGSAAKLVNADRGLLVVGVEPDGPGDKAGVLVGDILLALAGTSIGQSDSVPATLGSETVGTTLSMKILRGGEPANLALVVGEHPARGRRHA